MRVTLLTLLLCCGARLEAGVIHSSLGFSFSSGGGTQSLLLPQFNSALGTLTSVQIHMNGFSTGVPANVSASGSVLFSYNPPIPLPPAPAPPAFQPLTPSLWKDFGLTAPGASFAESLLFSAGAQTLGIGATLTLNLNKSVVGGPIVVSGPSLASYIGLGTTTIQVSGSGLQFSPSAIYSLPNSVRVTNAGSMSGNLRVSYLYDEAVAEVPEPSSFALLAIGGLLGAARCLRRRS